MTVIKVSSDGGGLTDQSDLVRVDVTCWIVSGGSRETFRSALLLLLTDCRFKFRVVVDCEFHSVFDTKCCRWLLTHRMQRRCICSLFVSSENIALTSY